VHSVTEKELEVAAHEMFSQAEVSIQLPEVISTALESAKIDIVGGETVFFDKIIGAISNGKAVERVLDNSETLSSLKNQLLDGVEGGSLNEKISSLINQFGISSDDLKNLSVTALIFNMMRAAKDDKTQGVLSGLLSAVQSAGIGELTPNSLGIKK
jgi:hypothetical protein